MISRRVVLPNSGWDAGTESHCQRVAAWSGELCNALGLSESDRKLVEQAAISHHIPEVLLNDDGRRRLLADLRVTEGGDKPLIPEDVRQLLLAFQGRCPSSGSALAKLATLLEISDDFDQFFEAEPLREPETAGLCTDSSVETMMSYLQVTSRADVGRVIDRLPVFPSAARDVVRYASNPESGIRELEKAASMDQVLAGLLIQTANSAYYSPDRPIAAIRHAISYIGLETARKVLLAAAVRSTFATLRHRQLWNHALDVAQVAEHLARRSKLRCEPAEAFLAGLVHDVGCLAFSMMPPNFLERFYRLTSRGCPPVEVEMCLAGLCHGEVGAETLKQWKFPDALVEAVRWHHRPERSSGCLASLVYLGEFWSGSEEDLPSCIRLRTALERAGISPETLTEIGRKEKGYLESLRFAA
jgi:putative nucleotidyltransferase with HDIG domain